MKIDVICRMCESKLRAPIVSGFRDGHSDIWITVEPCKKCLEAVTGKPWTDSIMALRGVQTEEEK